MNTRSRRRVGCVVEWIQNNAFKYFVLDETLISDMCTTKHGLYLFLCLI